MSLRTSDLAAEALMALLYVGVFLGSWLLGRKSRAGWLALALGNVAGITLNAYLGIYVGVVCGVVNLFLSVRGYLRWLRDAKEAPSHG